MAARSVVFPFYRADKDGPQYEFYREADLEWAKHIKTLSNEDLIDIFACREKLTGNGIYNLWYNEEIGRVLDGRSNSRKTS